MTDVSPIRAGAPFAPCGVVIVAHAPLASALLETAESVVGPAGEGVVAVNIAETTSTESVAAAIAETRTENGVLVMADLFGGTAANLALSQLGEADVDVITGVNLAMVVEVLHKRTTMSSLPALALKAKDAAQKSVVVASELLSSQAA